MKFRTEIHIPPIVPGIGYPASILSLGSCFAETIASRLAEAKFRIVANPTGVLFNPLSLARAIVRYAAGTKAERCELFHTHGIWFHYDFHGSFSGPSPEIALQMMNGALQSGNTALARSEWVLATFGSAWVYERADTGDVVANCHRQPQTLFRRRLLEVQEIVAAWSELLEGPLGGKQILLTVSPVRHLADGLEGNSLSKAVLRLAADGIARKFSRVRYFPAYEMLTDDLRDYRFYGDDLIHPSTQAAAYVWEKFRDAVLTPEARETFARVEEIVQAARHRPLHPGSAEHREFCLRMLSQIEALHRIDLHDEKAYFSRCLQIYS